MRTILASLFILCSVAAWAGPAAQPGDMGLRHDIQVLADYGAISGPVTTWPISWDAVLNDLEKVVSEDVVLPNRVLPTFERVLARARNETARGQASFNFGIAAAEKPVNIRGFSNTPREEGEVRAGASWTGERLSLDLNITGSEAPASRIRQPDDVYFPLSNDTDKARLDGSQLGVDLGNWSIAASTLERWWGPGWDGSLILSNNARPIPSLSIGRNLTTAPTPNWLRWIGPWDLQVLFGQLESDRAVPDARFFGLRFNFRPLRGLEIGVSRTAQWCGEGRPCDLGTLWDILIGNDNPGDGGVSLDDNPSNQMAGLDFRWTTMWFDTPVSFYGQAIGEDEAGGFPSDFLATFGVEGSHISRGQTSYRWMIEASDTSCSALSSGEQFGCAYGHITYESRYTYYRRIIGHGLDRDARVVSAAVIVVSPEGDSWHVLGRIGELNRGAAARAHSVADVPQDVASIDLQYRFYTRFGLFDLGAGFERREETASGLEISDTRGFLRWRYDWGHGDRGR
jgi:hypothetical protein